MISISPISSATSATKYYLEDEKHLNGTEQTTLEDNEKEVSEDIDKKADNYYLKDSDNTQWFGKLATEKGIAGSPVESQALQEVLSGYLMGEVLHGKREQHRAGTDLTFSAPKSVSILALVGGDKRLLDAHNNAVKFALSELEKDTAQVKHTDENTKKQSYANTHKMLFGLIQHKTSREDDPQLHTHALTANMTRDDQGRLRALATNLKQSGGVINGTLERVYSHQMYYGALYQSVLARGVEKAGYEIESIGNCQFEVKGVPKSLMDDFSTRSQQVNKKTKELGFDSRKTRDLAAKNTRKDKTYQDAVSLKNTWQTTVSKQVFEMEVFIEQSKHPTTQEQYTPDIKARASDALERTINHLSTTKNQLGYEKLISTAMSDFTKGERLDALDLKLALDEKITRGELISLDKNNSQFTTASLLENEKKLMMATTGRPRHMRTIPNENALAQLNLNKQNEGKVASLFTSTKQFNTVNVFGTSEQLATGLLHIGAESGKRIHIMTPDALTKEKTQRTITRQSHTPLQWVKNAFRPDFIHGVNQYLNDKVTPFNNKDVLIFEDTGKLSTNELLDITQHAKDSNSKVIFLNHASSRQGMKSHSSMDLLNKGNVRRLTWVNNKTSQVKVNLHDENIENLVNRYANSPDKSNLQVLATTNADVKTLNEAIREKLQKTGELSRQGVSITTLNPHFLSKQQRGLSTHYQPGLVLQSWEDNNTKKVMNQYRVLKHDRKHNHVDLLDAHGNKSTIDPSDKQHNFTAFVKETLTIAKGDKIRTNGTHYPSGLAAHQAFTIIEATPKSITLLGYDGQQKTINTKHLKDAPLIHNFANTTQKISDTATHLMVMTKAYTASKELLNELSLNRDKVDIFTDDKEKIVSNFDKSETKPATIERVLAATSSPEKYLSSTTANTVLKDVEQALSLLNIKNSQCNLDKAVNFSINHISEKEAGYTQQDLVLQAIRYSLEEAGSAINKADIIHTLKNNSELLSSEYSDGTRWTTKEALSTERAILNTLKQGKNQVSPFTTSTQASAFLQSKSRLTEGQKESVHMIATTSDRFVAVQGLAGTGKSTMLENNIALIHSIETLSGKETRVIGLAPTHAAVNELKRKGVEAQTLQSLLTDIDKGKTTSTQYSNTLFFLDESSMVGNQQMKNFTKLVEKSNAKAVLLGDMHQLQSLSAGKPFELAIRQAALDMTSMKDIVRQQNDTLLGAVHNMVDKQPESALDKLKHQATAKTGINKSHHVISTYEKRTGNHTDDQLIATEKLAQVVAADYLARTPKNQEDTLIIAYTNNERDNITAYIREGLQAQGQLQLENTLMPRLRSIGATREEMATLLPYKKGLILTTGKDNLSTVMQVDAKHGLITLKDNETGKTQPFFPKNSNHKMTNLFSRTDNPLCTNDRIMMRLTDKDKGIEANTTYTVIKIDKERITINNSKAHEIILSTQNLKDAHWDYAYTRTANMAQGATYKNVITAIKGSGQLTNIRRAYIDLTRASEHVKLYTDNEARLIKKWINTHDDKRAAIETNNQTIPKETNHFNNAPLPKENPTYHDVNGNLDMKLMAKALNQALAMRTESLATHLLGQPNLNKSSKDHLAFGSGPSSLKVTLTGPHRGYFKDWTTGDTGNGINLIMANKNLCFKDALTYADKLVNNPKKTPLSINKNHEKLLNTAPKIFSELEGRARQYQQESTPLTGTIAQHYLRQNGIDIERHPNITFHPNVYSSETRITHPAIISKLENALGESKSIEITYLDDKGNAAELSLNKRVLGTKTGANIHVNEGTNTNISIVTTTIEDALLINQNNPKDIDINTVNNKNDLQSLDKNTLRDNIIIVLDSKGDALNENNITKIMENLNDKNLSFIDNNEVQQQIKETIAGIEGSGGIDRVLETLENNADTLLNNVKKQQKSEIEHYANLHHENSQSLRDDIQVLRDIDERAANIKSDEQNEKKHEMGQIER